MSEMLYEARIAETLGKMKYHLSTHNSIAVGVSGGSDSDIVVHLIATNFRDFLPKIHFVFSDTGLEYEATKRHLKELEEKYDINIERIRGVSVVHAVKKYGVPVLSKDYSVKAHYFSTGSKWANDWRNRSGRYSAGRFCASDKEIKLAEAIKQRGIKVSDKCCLVSKKNPIHNFEKNIDADLSITGERRSEGGLRATKHKSCFEDGGVLSVINICHSSFGTTKPNKDTRKKMKSGTQIAMKYGDSNVPDV